MPFQIAHRSQALGAGGLAPLIGIILAFGFQPLSVKLTQELGLPFGPSGTFLALSCVFFISLPDPSCPRIYQYPSKRLLTLCALPLLISAGFGVFKEPGGHLEPALLRKEVLWSWAIAPISEELLFRGWMTALLNRWLKSSFGPWVPLLPLSLWGSAVAFSFWHLQNLSALPPILVFFQVFYTFFAGVWLGFLKWQTGKIGPPILAHILLNFAADWKLWFVL